MRTIKWLVILSCIFTNLTVSAQFISDSLRQIIINDSNFIAKNIQYPKQVKQFYTIHNFTPVWINNNYNKDFLINLINKADNIGLQKKDYQYNFFQSYIDHPLLIKNLKDSILAEICFTDIAIHFFSDIVYGNKLPALEYNGLKYKPDCLDISTLLVKTIENNRFNYLLSEIESKSKEYSALKNKIIQYNKILSDTNFKEIIISSTQTNTSNIELLHKLYQLGFLDSITQKINTAQLINKLKTAQKSLGLIDNGILKEETIKTLNVSLVSRIKELNIALNNIRWLNCAKQLQTIIVINIPSANLLVYKEGKVILESRIIVGKKSTPTPTQCSKISEVILNPRWTVPYKIATKEMLPIIQKNPNYLENNNFEVLDEFGEIVDPLTIDWSTLTPKYFPYTLRQSSGEGNALGFIKFNFYNPFNTYVHDTPQRGLFKRNKRYLSHGCMRLEKVKELEQLLLTPATITNINKLKAKDSLYGQAPTVLPVKEKIPIFILYNTAWIDAEGKIGFYEDIYEKNTFVNKKD